MKFDHNIAVITIIFTVVGLIFLGNIIPSQPILANASVVGFAVAGNNNQQQPEQSPSIISNINGFLAKNQLPEDTKIASLPIYILINIVFITTVILLYEKFRKKRK